MTLRDKAVEAAADLAFHLGLNASENEVGRLHDAIMATYAAAGWKPTPRAATSQQDDAARDWSNAKYGKPIGHDASRGCWSAQWDAAPSPEKADER